MRSRSSPVADAIQCVTWTFFCSLVPTFAWRGLLGWVELLPRARKPPHSARVPLCALCAVLYACYTGSRTCTAVFAALPRSYKHRYLCFRLTHRFWGNVLLFCVRTSGFPGTRIFPIAPVRVPYASSFSYSLVTDAHVVLHRRCWRSLYPVTAQRWILSPFVTAARRLVRSLNIFVTDHVSLFAYAPRSTRCLHGGKYFILLAFCVGYSSGTNCNACA